MNLPTHIRNRIAGAMPQGKTLAPVPFKRRGGRGKRKPPGEMNGTEMKYAARLEQLRQQGVVAWYAFESQSFRLAGRTTYTPDFLVMMADLTIEYHEVKGTTSSKKTGKKSAFVEPHNIIKLKVAAEKFPFFFSMFWIDKTQPDGWGRRDFWNDLETVDPSPISALASSIQSAGSPASLFAEVGR